MSFLDRFRKKKEDESSRFARLSTTGRIVEGMIIDLISDNDGQVTQVCYRYEINGVQYESAQDLNSEQQQRVNDYTSGARIIVRYEHNRPANSIVV
jgi:hypothetical protein